MTLTKRQVEQFKEDGFIVLRGFLDAGRCDAIRETALNHLEKMIEPLETEVGYDSRSKEYRTSEIDYSSKAGSEDVVVRRLRQVYDRSPLFQAWMEDREIRPILQQILEDQVVLTTAHHNSIMTKMPYASNVTRWHQDRRYWRYSDDNLVSVWLALDNETSENGVLEFIPGSHTMQFEAAQFDDKEYLSETYESNQTLINKKVSTDLQKGDVVIFHSLLLHRANKNNTDKPKISFVYTVKGVKTKATEGTRSSEFREILLEKV